MKCLLKTAALAAIVLTSNCAGTPIRYLTLDMEPSGSVSGASIQIDAIELSDALRRPELLVLARPTEIEYYSDTHWVSNLTELITEKLEAEFNSPSAAGDKPHRIRVKVWHFGEDETAEPRCGHVKVSVHAWSPRTPMRDDPNVSTVYDVCTPITGDDVSAVASALSEGLEDIAARIADDLSGTTS